MQTSTIRDALPGDTSGVYAAVSRWLPTRRLLGSRRGAPMQNWGDEQVRYPVQMAVTLAALT